VLRTLTGFLVVILNQDGVTALLTGAVHGQALIVTLLLDVKADVNHADNVGQLSPDVV
jgi:ankyrin repeat protein